MCNWQNRDKKLQKRKDVKKMTKVFQKQKDLGDFQQHRERRQNARDKYQELEKDALDNDGEE